MNYHHHNKNRNAENASYLHVRREAVRTVPLSAPPCSRPANGSCHKADVHKDPKINVCPGGAPPWGAPSGRCGAALGARCAG